jgi:transposase
MLRTDYTESDRNAFQQWRYQHPDPRIQRRFEILWLHANGQFAPEIATLVRQHVKTVRAVINLFKDGGIEPVLKIETHKPTSELEKHRTCLIEEFTRKPPSSAKEAAHRIAKLIGVERSPNRVGIFMKNIGMKFRKTAAIPAKADLEKQEEFKKNFRARDCKGESR